MEKAQWSPINNNINNNEPSSTSAASSVPAKKQHPGLTRLPINFSNTTLVRPKKRHTESPKHVLDRPPLANNDTLSGDLSASRAESRSSKPREMESAGSSSLSHTNSSTPPTIMSPDEVSSKRRGEGKRHEIGSSARNPTSMPNSRAGTQTPKVDHQTGVAVAIKSIQPQNPTQIESAKELYQAFNIPPPENDPIINERESDTVKVSETEQNPVKITPGPRDTITNFSKASPNENTANSHQRYVKPVQDHQPFEVDEQSSSSSDDDAANIPANTRPLSEEAIEETESPVMNDGDHVTTAHTLPDDHPVEWLAKAREIYQHSLPPFVTKQKLGVRRMVELPLAPGQQDAGKIQVVYRSWDALHTFASIDKDGQRFIVKVFRGGATPYRPWLGPQTGFSEKALAYSKQGPRGPKAVAATQGKRLSLPKGWAFKEDEEDDDEYSPGIRRKSVNVRDQQRVNYDLNDEEAELDENPDQGDSYQIVGNLQSGRSSMEEDDGGADPPGDRRADSHVSSTRPPSKLINAVKKSLRLPKNQDESSRTKQIKRRSIGGQGITKDAGVKKRGSHKVDFSSDSENPAPHKRAKGAKDIPHRSLSTNSENLKHVSQTSDNDPRPLEAQTLSPYKQAHTTLRIALVPYPQQVAIQRIRSCMTITTFFSTVIGVSGYKGDRERIFGITATFDSKSDDDADRSMVIREEWQDSFDIFLETVDGAESWTEDGGKCGVSVGLLLSNER